MNAKTIAHRRARVALAPATLAVAVAATLWAPSSHAFRFGSEEGLSGSFDSTVSFGMSARTGSAGCSTIGNDSGGCNNGTDNDLSRVYNLGNGLGYANADFNFTNFDDGNLNYKKGDVFSAALKGTHDLSLKYPGGWSALARVTWFKDFKAKDTRRTDVASEAEGDVTLLDAWVAKSFSIGEQYGKIKLGNQVISWGEDIFILGGVNQINAIDLQKFHIPGTQLKEIFIPAPMLSGSFGLTEKLGMEAYYQFAWNSFKFDPSGTFFSTADVLGKGRRVAYLPGSICNDFGLSGPCGDQTALTDPERIALGTAVPYLGSEKPKRGGQYGVNFRYTADEIDTEFAFTYQRYHDKLPFLGFTGNSAGAVTGYYVAYGENKDLYAISANTKLFNVAVGAELSYRPNDSVGIDPTVPFGSIFGGSFDKNSVYDVGRHPGYVEEEKYQFHLTGFYTFSHNDPLGGLAKAVGASDGFILTEAAVTHYPGLDTSGRTPYFLPDYSLPDKTSWGYVFEMGLNYPNAFGSGVTLTPQIDWYHDVSGTSPNAIPFVQGRKALTLSLFANYRDSWKAAIQWVNFHGGGANNLMRDRDFIAASVSYSF
ncbi:DUF1302 family protein [Azoarcus communis]|uniref:DUF1302 domain-containing protein n=1 Tax=Parazoarcus communis SWub3 = DSM 12120 TaxID=1121029 RepID=A0A323UZQ2_9RHOO|nr:DUF1302 domain-containing protein [Parazoarcus communis]NMG46806.1 DUF1302 family protein [Parazoarcus communis]NMG69912.1 DUF1302 family protein [Parazoarcus communis SWub3 = DSM 12120]PZA16646.1 DUF1302 domain-containing protein [Azoarcus communis] [Parazoarcus communis SWub3 = DSM 12120]